MNRAHAAQARSLRNAMADHEEFWIDLEQSKRSSVFGAAFSRDVAGSL